MAKMVGYACSVKKSWHRKAIQLLIEGHTEEEYKSELNAYLAYEIDSETRIRKTREILMNIWFYNKDDVIVKMRKEALQILKNSSDDDSIIYYCMTCLTYPVFADVSKIMGKLFEFQNEITTHALKRKLYDSWGERGTLEATSRRITLTMKELGILSDEKRGKYEVKRKAVNNQRTIDFMLYVAINIDDSGYNTFSEIKEFSLLFPYEYEVDKDAIMECEWFDVSNYAGERTISIK